MSPALHTAAYRELGLDGWSYQAIECDEASLPALIDSLGPDWAGLSLTMPLKRAVLPLLDRHDPLVGLTGAANTVVLADRTRVGHNTDVPGMLAALEHAAIDLVGPVLLLGGGATASSAICALAQAGVDAATVAVRDKRSAAGLEEVAAQVGVSVRLVPFAPDSDWLADPVHPHWKLLVSTVPAGAADGYAQLIGAGLLAVGAVFDVVYNPWPTALATAAEAASVPVVGGLELLLHQAADQVTLMTGLPAPLRAMRTGLAEAAARSQSIR